MPARDYVRRAAVLQVVDGDTLDVDLDLGFGVSLHRRVRLLGVNCPECHGPTREAGLRAAAAARAWCEARHNDVLLRTPGDRVDSFGRVLAEVWSGKDSLAAHLLASGHAVVFMGLELGAVPEGEGEK